MRSTITEVSTQWQDSNKKLKEVQEINDVGNFEFRTQKLHPKNICIANVALHLPCFTHTR